MRPSKLILASASPRRQALLTEAKINFEISIPDIDETLLPAELAARYVKRLALSKATAVAQKIDTEGCVILAADTAVVINDHILGKPVDTEEACLFLSRLAGQTHEVLTGVCLLKMGQLILHEVYTSKVTMKSLTPDEIKKYVQTGEPMDKAGAYAAQGVGKQLITKIDGSLNNVIGLPVEELMSPLTQAGVIE